MTTQETSPAAGLDMSTLDDAARRRVAVLDDLAWRGLIATSTDLDALRAAAAEGPITLVGKTKVTLRA